MKMKCTAREIFPKIFIGKATLQPMEDIEYLIDGFLEMTNGKFESMLLELANRKKELEYTGTAAELRLVRVLHLRLI